MLKFLKTLHSFLKENYYILIIAIVVMVPIILTQQINTIFETLFILFSHLIADIFMVLMVDSFSKWKIYQWYIYQLIGSIIFLLIGIYSYLFHNDSIYLIPSLIYFPVVFKNIYEYKSKNKIKIFNEYIISIYWFILFICTLSFYNISSIATIIQFLGVLFFAVILSFKNQKLINTGWIITISLMILGWSLKIYNEAFIENIINWATFSYTILPLVVLIGFIKDRKNIY